MPIVNAMTNKADLSLGKGLGSIADDLESDFEERWLATARRSSERRPEMV